MHGWKVGSMILGSLVILAHGPDAAGHRNPASGRAFKDLLDAVVRIDVREISFERGAKRIVRGVGSGVIMSASGHVLTNAHVVSPKAEEVSVTLASLERVSAELIGWDHWTDLALLQLDLSEVDDRGLSFSRARFGDSCDLIAGQTVFAVGTPNGLTRTVTRGIISNTKRYFEGSDRIGGYETGYFNTWLQTDAAINPGNSGGPLVTEDGRVVGINTRGYLGANNLGFAVPSAIAERVMEQLTEHGEVVRSYIGVTPGPLQDLETFYNLESNRGMLVHNVDPGSPADNAGLRPGDIVLTIEGGRVDGRFPEQLPPIRHFLASFPVGVTVVLKIKRDERVQPIEVVTERLESRVGEQWVFQDWGLSVERVSRAVARERKLVSTDGVFVLGTQAAFPASEAGVRRGDIITKINREPIPSLQRLKDIYENYRTAPYKVFLEVQRSHQVSYFVLKP